MTLKSVVQAIEEMSDAELSEFRRWFTEYDGARWDDQIEADAIAGKLDKLAEEAMAEYLSGNVTEL